MLNVIDKPIVRHKISMLQDVYTKSRQFREVVGEVATILAYEAMEDALLDEKHIQTPLNPSLKAHKLTYPTVIVPILRAGLGMSDAISNFLPDAPTGHIGLYRDHDTLMPQKYYSKLPDVRDKRVLLCDPMAATGGSFVASLRVLKGAGATIGFIHCLILFATKRAVETIENEFPEVNIWAAWYDPSDDALDANGYIKGGCGDAGDRIFGTK